ncbi:hypothetical protein [Aquimarina macrocephali]|uniref:hypothetical protein n=1 Tax=Aquimarina macrocephali TaxID=666563 RepID=UPI0004676C23|nr:hypothetical protein [Aquimarina macrocephali]
MTDNYESLIIPLRDIALYSEYISAIVAILFFFKYKNTQLKYFAFILIYVALNELLGGYLRDSGISYNYIIYNIYNIITFSYFFLLYRNHLKKKLYKKTVMAFFVIYLLAVLINGFYQNYLNQAQTTPYILASVFLIVSIIFYFIEILNSQKVLYVNKNLLFWISIGLFLYYIGIIPFRIITNSFASADSHNYLFLIKFILVVVMNSCFIIGFIWSNKKQEY